MGGHVNVAIRFKDGRTICQERWTNNLPHWLKVPGVYRGDEGHLRRYASMVATNEFGADELGSPQPIEESEYGLVVIDLMSGCILDSNRYCHLHEFNAVEFGGVTANPAFKDFAKAGFLRHSVYELQDRGPGPYVRVQRSTSARLTFDEAVEMAEATYAKEFGQRARVRPAKPELLENFLVDAPGMAVHKFWWDDERPSGTGVLHPEMRAKLEELGIPTSFEAGLLVDHRPLYCVRAFALDARVALAKARLLQSLNPTEADLQLQRAWEAAELAGEKSFAQSPFIVGEPLLEEAAAVGQATANVSPLLYVEQELKSPGAGDAGDRIGSAELMISAVPSEKAA